jgi:type I restriction enzyme S subunit
MSKHGKKGLVPELRFPEFRGKGEWNSEPFDKIYDLKITNSFSRDKLNYKEGTVKNIHYGDIHTKFSTLFNIEKECVPYINASESLDKIKPDSYCRESDMVFADASEDMDDIGKSIEIVNLNGEKLLSGLHTLLARQIDEKLIRGFGGHLFKSGLIRKQIQREAQGAKVLGISAGRISSIDVSYPSDKNEQQKIAECLTSIDDVITAQIQKLGALKAYKKGLMQQLFPAKGERVPKLRFPEFKNAREWNVSTIEGICLVSSGGTPSRAKPEYWNGDIPWISTTLIDFNKIEAAKEYITEKGLRDSSTKIFPNGTILMAMYGQGKTRGKVAMLGIDAAINQACAALSMKKGMNKEFVFQNLAGRYDEIRDISNQGGQENLSAALIKKIPFSYPDIKSNEQQKIANCLSSIDNLIPAQRQKIEALQTHKKGLMQKLFPVVDEVKA